MIQSIRKRAISPLILALSAMVFSILFAVSKSQVWNGLVFLVRSSRLAVGQAGNISVTGIVTILIVAGLLVPIGMDFINDADTGSWTASQILAWAAIGTIAIVAIVLGLLQKSGLRGDD